MLLYILREYSERRVIFSAIIQSFISIEMRL
ncbi:hypothetical protein T4A_5590 [Trichinella pseudospiralis]|uniref:Uncharacterized protein n=1 Tax=Trichinella pseudospiralis TaxID=6337 RepID=A0A0V1CF51_TRIPS|nr:hypothetical protein T4A_5590 [Trichinella pseudospiralis]